jgi:type IV pilus assembly protein PilQ
VSVSNIDFKRGEGGSGKLILRFTATAPCPTCATRARRWWSTSATPALPASLQRPLNVADFATPVRASMRSSAATARSWC